METIIVGGMSAGVLTVILCTSGIARPLREIASVKRVGVLECCFCTSFWCSLLHNPTTSVLATVAVANVTIMLTHWSMSTQIEETDEASSETETL